MAVLIISDERKGRRGGEKDDEDTWVVRTVRPNVPRIVKKMKDSSVLKYGEFNLRKRGK